MISNRVPETIAGLTREQMIEEFRHYCALGGVMNIDLDLNLTMQAAEKSDDAALGAALLRIATICGNIFGRNPLMAAEARKCMEGRGQEIWKRRAVTLTTLNSPEFSLRKSTRFHRE